MKEKQIEAVCTFIKRHDTFVSLPIGYEKSLANIMLFYHLYLTKKEVRYRII